VNQLVHTPRSQSGPDSINHRHARIDIADELGLALTGVRALLEQNDLGLLQSKMQRPRSDQTMFFNLCKCHFYACDGHEHGYLPFQIQASSLQAFLFVRGLRGLFLLYDGCVPFC
jgi:hypothetical protein